MQKKKHGAGSATRIVCLVLVGIMVLSLFMTIIMIFANYDVFGGLF